jgi:hypothetical protein
MIITTNCWLNQVGSCFLLKKKNNRLHLQNIRKFINPIFKIRTGLIIN